jgi:hypothetical protein
MDLLLAKKELKDRKESFDTRNAAHHLKKGEGLEKRKKRAKETKIMAKELTKFERLEESARKKRENNMAKSKIGGGAVGRRPIKTRAVEMSKDGISSWIPIDSKAVAQYVRATEAIKACALPPH